MRQAVDNQTPAEPTSTAMNRLIAPVTGLKFIEDDRGTAEPQDRYLFAAIGNQVQIFLDGDEKPCTIESIFPPEYRIHGFSDVADGRMIIFGGRIVATARVNFAMNNTRVKLLERTEFPDWVWDVHWLPSNGLLAVACGHSTTYICDAEDLDEYFKLQSEERELTWSTALFIDSGELFGIAGSSFGDVLSWKILSATLMKELAKNGMSGFTDTKLVETPLPVHRLKAHDGPIMRITISEDRRFMATASVDRSVRVWKREKGECIPCDGVCYTQLLTHYGHLARVWDVCFTEETGVVSVGEDHVCRVWGEKSGLEKACFHGHSGRNIWRVAVSRGMVATGGEDGGVIVRPLQGVVTTGPFPLPRFENPRKKGLFKELGRSIVAIDDTHFVITTDYGRILHGCFEECGVKWTILFSQGTAFTPCSLIVKQEMILAGRTDGSVVALRNGLFIGTMRIDGMVMSIFADAVDASYDVFIASPHGSLSHYHITPQNTINYLGKYEMRNMVKSSLVTAACVLRQKSLLITGDRGGRVHAYELHDTSTQAITNALSTLKPHTDRVSTLTPRPHHIETTSFDGSYTTLHTTPTTLSLTQRKRLPERTDTITATKGGCIFALHGAEGVLWRDGQEVMRADIGNWRRAHDITTNGVLFWRGGIRRSVAERCVWGALGVLGGRINGMCVSGEDVFLAGNGVCVTRYAEIRQRLPGHRSVVQGICAGVLNGLPVVVSCGALDEVFLWGFDKGVWCVKKRALCGNGELTGRLGCVCIGDRVIVGRCDGGVWRLDDMEKGFKEMWKCGGGVVCMDSGDGVLVVGDTKGFVYICYKGNWTRLTGHEGGVNDVKLFQGGFLSGGDDGWVRYYARKEGSWRVRWGCQGHSAAVGGLVVVGNRGYSVGTDQRVVEWDGNGMLKWRMHSVVDPSCAIYDKNANEIVIGGIGMCRMKL